MEEIKLDNGSLRIESKNDNNNKIEIIFSENNGNIYSTNKFNLDDNISLDDFIKKLKTNIKIENKGNDNELALKIENYPEKIALKLKSSNTNKGEESTNIESAPLPEFSSTKKGNEFDKKFYEDFEKLKKEKEELIKKNISLRIDIEKEKKLTDELLRVFYENRLKYYEAEEKNQQISQILEE